MKNLYLLTTAGLGDYHVIAKDPTEAQVALIAIFEKQDYGFSKDREVENIKLITKSFRPDFADNSKPFLSDKTTRLFIIDDWTSGAPATKSNCSEIDFKDEKEMMEFINL